MRSVGSILRELRGNRSGREVAKALNVSVSALYMWENDQRTPTDEKKRKLAKYYNTTVQNIFFRHQGYKS